MATVEWNFDPSTYGERWRAQLYGFGEIVVYTVPRLGKGFEWKLSVPGSLTWGVVGYEDTLKKAQARAEKVLLAIGEAMSCPL